MKYQSHNPYLPLEEHIPDGEPLVFGDRLYIFGSHDLENGNEFCEQDYVTWSAPVDDLSDWRYEGVIYRKDQDPYNKDCLPLYAPDVVKGPDGRYYLYYCVKFQDSINVAVADEPAGPYEFYGRVHYQGDRLMSDNQPYDPSVIVMEGHVYLYFGFAPCRINIPRYKNQDLKGGSVVELDQDMLTVIQGPVVVLPSADYGKGTGFEGHEYFEGPSIRRIDGRFYLIYSSVNTHELCYAVSDKPMEGFTYGGCIVDNGDVGYQGRSEEDKLNSVGNNHGGLVCVKGQWYMFYHRHTSLTQYNRQGCAERVYFAEDGSIPQVTITSSGINDGPLSGQGTYPAVFCCNLTNGHMGALNSLGRSNKAADFPYMTSVSGERYITNIAWGTLIGYKYIDLERTTKVTVTYKASEGGQLLIFSSLKECEKAQKEIDAEKTRDVSGDVREKDADNEVVKAVLTLEKSEGWTKAAADVHFSDQEQELYFLYEGTGTADLLTLELS